MKPLRFLFVSLGISLFLILPAVSQDVARSKYQSSNDGYQKTYETEKTRLSIYIKGQDVLPCKIL